MESATDAGLELNKILSDFLTSQKENADLNSAVDKFKDISDQHEHEINGIKRKLKAKDDEV